MADHDLPLQAQDARFAAFGYDPRFRRPKAKETSIKLEKRFARVVTDKRFNDLGVSSMSKSGFAIEGDVGQDETKTSGSTGGGASSQFEGLESRLELLNMMARGEIEVDGSSSDDSDDEVGSTKAEAMTQDLDAQLLAAEATDAAPDIGEGHSAPQTAETTRRLALVNLDWDHTRAEDIFALLKSFVPATGQLERVSVFPSDYGEKMIAQEAALGPKGIWTEGTAVDQGTAARKARLRRLDEKRDERRSERQAARQRRRDLKAEKDQGSDVSESGEEDEDEDHAEDEDEGDDGDGDHEDGKDDEDEEQEDEGAFDPEKLRRYELGRLRYYFAEAVFDSPATAAKVYEECDGREFGSTGNVVDLRYIPDDTSFAHKVARDVAASVDVERYEAPEFSTSALRSTNVELSWDAPDPRRQRKLRQWISEMRDAEVEGKRQRRRKKKLAGMLTQGRADGVTAEDVAARQEEDLRQFLAPASDDEEDEFRGDEDGDGDDDGDDDEEGEDEDLGDDHDAGMRGPKRSQLSTERRAKHERLRLRREKREEARRKAQLLLAVLDDSDDEAAGASAKREHGGADDYDDMGGEGGVRESTFVPGLGKTLQDKRAQRALEREETPWEAYQRKRKEKKAEKRRLRKEQRSSDQAVGSATHRAGTAGSSSSSSSNKNNDDDDNGGRARGNGGSGGSDLYDDFAPPVGEAETDPFFSLDKLQLDRPLQEVGFSSAGASQEAAAAAAGLRVASEEELERRRKQQRAERAEKAARAAEEAERERRERANLELLMMADPGTAEAAAESDTRGFDVRALAQAHKDATGKGGSMTRKRRREEAKTAVEQDTFVVNTADSRFQRVGMDPDMAIDPTNPAFKDTPAMRGLMADTRSRRLRAGSDTANAGDATADTKPAAGGATISGGAALAALVATVKRQAAGAAKGMVLPTDRAKMEQLKSVTAAAARRARSASRTTAGKRSQKHWV